MTTQRTAPAAPVAPVAIATAATTAAAAERSALNPCGTFQFAKTGVKTLAMLAVAGLLAACGSTSVSPGSGDSAGTPQGASGITVFGDIDVGVTRQRSR